MKSIRACRSIRTKCGHPCLELRVTKNFLAALLKRQVLDAIDPLSSVTCLTDQFKVSYASANCHEKLVCIDHSGEGYSASLAHRALSKEIGITRDEYTASSCGA